MEELDKVMIAGQFGAHLPAESLTGTGILPKEVEDKLSMWVIHPRPVHI